MAQGQGGGREGAKGALTLFVGDSILDAASSSRATLSLSIQSAAKPQAVARLVDEVAVRAAVVAATDEHIHKMPDILAKLEAALDESLACAKVIHEIAATGHRHM